MVFTLLSQGAGDPITSKDDSKVAGLWYRTTGEVIKSAAESYSDGDWYRIMSSSPPKRRVARSKIDMTTRIKCKDGQILVNKKICMYRSLSKSKKVAKKVKFIRFSIGQRRKGIFSRLSRYFWIDYRMELEADWVWLKAPMGCSLYVHPCYIDMTLNSIISIIKYRYVVKCKSFVAVSWK